MQQAHDLLEEGNELNDMLTQLNPSDWERTTPFKGWSINNVITHLHASDRVAALALSEPETLREIVAQWLTPEEVLQNGVIRDLPTLDSGPGLREQWHESLIELCKLLEDLEPSVRIPWYGPDMSARMFTTARQMETWAHGQDIYDLLKVKRTHTDRIKNIAVIGVRTFGWSFAHRGLEIPNDVPYVCLTGPSSAVWEWNEPNEANRIDGSAIEFCHVVTQGRNITDTALNVVGDTASRWMSIAQCFAGNVADPPAPGERTWNA
jgi:uncharacterized protein (TIGR03084 family)